MEAKPKQSLQRRYYDTFDWRLYRNGYVFETNNVEPLTGQLRTLGGRGDQITTILKQEPDFARNFEQSKLREFLTKFLAARRLLCQAEARVNVELFEVMDSGGKVLLRMELEKFQRPDRMGRHRSILVNCRFNPLRGYHNVCSQLLDLIDADIGRTDINGDPLLVILSADKKLPGGYTSKFNLTFNPDMSIGQVLAQTLLFHIDVMVRNLPGIRDDLDAEFLHDLRIANRRSRTLVTQIKQVLPPVKEKYYREIFSWLSNATSEHRDLDVFLLDIPRHLAMLPVTMRNDLEPLRVALAEQRDRVHTRLVQLFDSEKFRGFASESRAYLTAGLRDHFQTATGSRPALVIANQVIWRVYQKMLKQGDLVSRSGDREALHELRKTAKKLRYLLETFRSLYPQQDIENVIMHCRKLQNILGQIVDFHVQQRYLQGLAGNAENAAAFPEATVACIRYLIDAYNQLEGEAYAKFAGRFAHFSEPGTREQFKALLRSVAEYAGAGNL
ncbi:MAG: CHAD protein [Gammaproteobacteria bacterium]|nr:CHAD protein [Gammaproteobacteria bacterium]